MHQRSLMTDPVNMKSRRGKNGRAMRMKILMHDSARFSLASRLQELDMSMSDYLRLLVQKDIGVKV